MQNKLAFLALSLIFLVGTFPLLLPQPVAAIKLTALSRNAFLMGTTASVSCQLDPSSRTLITTEPIDEPDKLQTQDFLAVNAPSQPRQSMLLPQKTTPFRKNSSTPQSVNINTDAQTKLQLLPGIGPAIASRIITDRLQHGRFTSVDDLQRVRGIGPKTLAKLRDYIRI
ncbi:MAG: ComEA family DNA-binding protein [Cyanobacteria bacterium P01_H01_bin.74]